MADRILVELSTGVQIYPELIAKSPLTIRKFSVTKSRTNIEANSLAANSSKL